MTHRDRDAIAMLRASAPNFDPVDFLERHGLKADAVWRRGEERRRGAIQENSGFNLLVAECSSHGELAQALHEFLHLHSGAVADFARAGIAAELDIGLMVYPFGSTGFQLPPALMADIAGAGLSLRISCYPCSDDEDDGTPTPGTAPE